MPTIGSETYRSSEPPESATKETKVSESAMRAEAIKGEDYPEGSPVVEALEPSTLLVPGPDQDVVVIGTGFNQESVIVWNGGDEPTEFVSDIKLRTIVKPSTVEAPLPFTLPVYVRNGTDHSNILDFTFEEAEEEEGAGRRKHGKISRRE